MTLPRSMLALAVTGALLLSACSQVCDQPDATARKACQDQEFAAFQQQLQDSQPRGGRSSGAR